MFKLTDLDFYLFIFYLWNGGALPQALDSKDPKFFLLKYIHAFWCIADFFFKKQGKICFSQGKESERGIWFRYSERTSFDSGIGLPLTNGDTLRNMNITVMKVEIGWFWG